MRVVKNQDTKRYKSKPKVLGFVSEVNLAPSVLINEELNDEVNLTEGVHKQSVGPPSVF